MRELTIIGAMTPAVTSVRLSLHVLGAAIWVGGQFTIAGLLPTARRLGSDVPRTLARAFGRVQWPAYVLLLGTGIWNVVADHAGQHHAWQVVLGVKIGVVVLAGLSAFIHQRSRSKAGLALFGALASLSSLAAIVLGVVLAG